MYSVSGAGPRSRRGEGCCCGSAERVKATPRQPGVEEIRLPGERAFRERARSLREGIEIDRKIYDALLALPQGKLPDRQH